jgi:hypothetical protein
MPRPVLPRAAVVLDVARDAHAPHALGFDNQRRQKAARRVPGHVAVEGPDACGLGFGMLDAFTHVGKTCGGMMRLERKGMKRARPAK